MIFDPETIIDHATYEDPHQYATGRVHVFVNGAQVLADGPLAVGLSASAPPCELPGEGGILFDSSWGGPFSRKGYPPTTELIMKSIFRQAAP